ncbi:MAG TPA: heavy-metal-associated domain-containing protein [Sulfuricurvum sp.]|nr:heavy-metal-associated domain-containing protein [Sulfuricurvum sp.]
MIQTFEIANVRCGGCTNTITKALKENGFEKVEIDLSCEPRKVTVDIADEAQLAHFKAVLRKLGYPLVNEEVGGIDAARLKFKSFVSCVIGKIN